jgi:hypothetical protein
LPANAGLLEENPALVGLHSTQLPGLRHHTTEEKNERSVVNPEYEEHDGPNLSVARYALDRRDVCQIKAVEPLRDFKAYRAETGRDQSDASRDPPVRRKPVYHVEEQELEESETQERLATLSPGDTRGRQ